MRREHVNICNFLVTLVLFGAILALLVMLQGNGLVSLSSDKLVANSLELILLLLLLAFVATFLLVEFFLIGIPQLALLCG